MRRQVIMDDSFSASAAKFSRGKRDRDSVVVVGGNSQVALPSTGSSNKPRTVTGASPLGQQVVSERGPLVAGLGVAAATEDSAILRSLGLSKLQQDVLFKQDAGKALTNAPRPWTAEEDFSLVEEVMTHGPRWSHISRVHEPHREPQALSQRYTFVESVIAAQQQEGPQPSTVSPGNGSANPLTQLVPLRSVIEHWHMNHQTATSSKGRRLETRKVVHAQVLKRVEQLTNASSTMSSGSSSSRGAGNKSWGGSNCTEAVASVTVSSRSAARPLTLSSSSSARNSPGHSSLEHVSTEETPSPPDFPESLDEFNHLFPKPSADVRAAAQTATMFSTKHQAVVEASIQEESVQGFVNTLVEGEFNHPEQSTSTCNVLESQPPSQVQPQLEPLLSVMEEVDIDIQRPQTAAPTAPPASVHWGPDQLHAKVAISVHDQVEAPTPSTQGSTSVVVAPPATTNLPPQPSTEPIVPTAAAQSSKAATTAGAGTTAFMAAWLNLQNNGLSSNPVWTSVVEQPRCMYKAVMPRLIAYLPLPWVYGIGQQFNVLIPNVAAMPLPSALTMAAAVTAVSNDATSRNSKALKKQAEVNIDQKILQYNRRQMAKCSPGSGRQEAKLFGTRETSADSPSEENKPKVRICPYTIIRGRVQSLMETPTAPRPSVGVF